MRFGAIAHSTPHTEYKQYVHDQRDAPADAIGPQPEDQRHAGRITNVTVVMNASSTANCASGTPPRNALSLAMSPSTTTTRKYRGVHGPAEYGCDERVALVGGQRQVGRPSSQGS